MTERVPRTLGPGVRIALYLQSLLSGALYSYSRACSYSQDVAKAVLLVRFSPRDAPGAYWSMTSTAFSLIISSIVTSVKNEISLLDAIVVVYGKRHSRYQSIYLAYTKRSHLASRSSIRLRPLRNHGARVEKLHACRPIPPPDRGELGALGSYLFIRTVRLDRRAHVRIRNPRVQRAHAPDILRRKPAGAGQRAIPQPCRVGPVFRTVRVQSGAGAHDDTLRHTGALLVHCRPEAAETEARPEERGA